MNTENYKKDFDRWNSHKKAINKKENKKTFHEREVWFIKIGENIGFEEDGIGEEFLRPVIVHKKFSKNVFLGIPLTKSNKDGRFYSSFELKGEKSNAILSQVRLLDSKRLKYKLGKMSVGDYQRAKEKLIELIQ